MNDAKKLYRNRSWLVDRYRAREESTPVMAQEARCHHKTILRWLHKMGIPIRTISESTFLARRNSLALSSDLLELLEGELLGDGCVLMTGNRSASYGHSSKYEEYVAWLSTQFADLGLEQSGKIGEHRDKLHGTLSYHYKSRSYPELVGIRNRWYPNNVKTVPKDLKLTSVGCRQWYLGDGGLQHPKRGRSYIRFATEGFDQQSVEYLVEELNKLGFKVARWPSENSIGLSAYSAQDFLDYIGPCPVRCYDYKWDAFKRGKR